MIKIENVEIMGWEHVIRGMRNPMNSWQNRIAVSVKAEMMVLDVKVVLLMIASIHMIIRGSLVKQTMI